MFRKPEKGTQIPACPHPIRILLADDDTGVRAQLAKLLQEESDLEIIAQASDGQQAVKLALKLKPDVVIMDGYMPKLDGIGATRQIVTILPQIRVIGLSRYRSEHWFSEMAKAGAYTALAKGARDDLLAAIRARVC